MADSGIQHVVSSVPVPRSEYEDEEHHALIHGTSYPSSPVERQLYYRDDLHKWYIYNGSSWVETTSQGVTVHNDLTGRDAASCHPLSAISSKTLNGLDDVSVPSPTDGYILYWDNATSRWKCKAHTALTTGVHGAGSDHLALFGVASTVVSKFTAKSVATELWRRDDASDSSFEALINGSPTSTSVVYDNDVRENSLPDPTARPQWGKVILHNITRGNSRYITGVNLATNTITTEASVDDWADNDIITIGSQVCDFKGGFTYSRFFDINISSEVPATVAAALLELFVMDLSHASDAAQNNFGTHPCETYAAANSSSIMASSDDEASMAYVVVPVNSQKICAQLGSFGGIPGAGAIALIRLRGYWE